MTQHTDEFLCTKAVAELLQITTRTLYRWVQKGAFPSPVRINLRVLRWRRSEVLDALERMKERQHVA